MKTGRIGWERAGGAPRCTRRDCMRWMAGAAASPWAAWPLSGCGGRDAAMPPTVAGFEGGRRLLADGIPTVVLTGSWLAMGRQYGALLAGEIAATHARVMPYAERANRAFDKPNQVLAEELFQSYPARFRALFDGMAQTSGLSLQALKLANALEIVMMFGDALYANRCSALSAWGEWSDGARLVYGRNYDYTDDLLPLDASLVVTVFHPDDGSIPFAICTWAGCLYASTGLNQAGLFVEENDCSPHDRQAGGFFVTGDHLNMKTWVQDDVQLLSLLAEAGSMAQADAWMRSHLPIYPHNIGLADRHEARCVQWNVRERVPHAPWARQAPGLMAQTNHYFVVPAGWDLAPYVEQDATGSAIPGGSVQRLQNLLSQAQRFKGRLDVRTLCQVMDLTIEQGGATHASGTLYQVVCEPQSFTFLVKTQARRDRWADIPLSRLLFETQISKE